MPACLPPPLSANDHLLPSVRAVAARHSLLSHLTALPSSPPPNLPPLITPLIDPSDSLPTPPCGAHTHTRAPAPSLSAPVHSLSQPLLASPASVAAPPPRK